MTTNHVPLPEKKTLVGIAVLFAILIVQALIVKTHFPKNPKEITLEHNIALLSPLQSDNKIAQVHKGDKVQFLGVVAGDGTIPYGLLVQTKEGERGLLAAADMDFPMVLKDDDNASPVKVQSMVREKNILYYHIVTASGEKQKVEVGDVRPVLPKEYRKLFLNERGEYYMSKAKFERKFLNHTLEKKRPSIPACMDDRQNQ